MQSGFWQHTELNLHRFSSLPWLRCRQEGSLGAEFVISGKRLCCAPCRCIWVFFITSLQSGLGFMKWRCPLLLLSWAQGQTSRGRAELWQRMEKCHRGIPQLQWLHTLLPTCTMCCLLHGDTERGLGVFCLCYVYLASGSSSGLAVQFPNARGDAVWLQFCHVIKT